MGEFGGGGIPEWGDSGWVIPGDDQVGGIRMGDPWGSSCEDSLGG